MSTTTVSWPRIGENAEPWIQMVKGQGGSGQLAVVLHWHNGVVTAVHYELRGSRREPFAVSRYEEP